MIYQILKTILVIGVFAILISSCSSSSKINSDYRCMGSCGDHHRTGTRR